ncbi:MAG TPA: hypothetical protein VJZ00_12850 [Thermoanaerobaculia bacterium]|nr:hypothetical protein [Thermoanaerobaculia bacterium]
MPTEVEVLRDLAREFWAGKVLPCPRHPGGTLVGSFVQTTFADHIFLTCSKGRETITIPQRPKQMEFYDQQVEGFVENIQRGDAILCYRCQSKIETNAKPNPETGITDYTFTCIRCFSWGRWVGKPELAKIGG